MITKQYVRWTYKYSLDSKVVNNYILYYTNDFPLSTKISKLNEVDDMAIYFYDGIKIGRQFMAKGKKAINKINKLANWKNPEN